MPPRPSLPTLGTQCTLISEHPEHPDPGWFRSLAGPRAPAPSLCSCQHEWSQDPSFLSFPLILSLSASPKRKSWWSLVSQDSSGWARAGSLQAAPFLTDRGCYAHHQTSPKWGLMTDFWDKTAITSSRKRHMWVMLALGWWLAVSPGSGAPQTVSKWGRCSMVR